MSIKKILISQATPQALSPYETLTAKYGVSFDFAPFYTIQPLSSIEMRAQHCNVLDYTAIVFSARSTIDAFFSICEELRFKIPETMKFFCTTDKVAMYLQKHIVYRKRKIFYGDGTPSSVLGLITAKHKDENFLIVASDVPSNSISKVFDTTSFKHTCMVFAKTVSSDLSALKIKDYDMIVMYNKADVASLQANFPDFKQGKTALVTYGSASLKQAATDAGLQIAISAPAPECPSVSAAIEYYIQHNK